MIDKEQDTKIQQDISHSEFEFVQRDEKIFDKKFETKPVGYFKDAMTRFAKNRANVVATIILFTLITSSILVPVLTTKNFTSQEPAVAALPPRVPIVEHFGFVDGTRSYSDRTVDLETIDEDGLGIPAGFDREFVAEGSLTNTTSVCTSRTSDSCVGGQNIIGLRGQSTQTSVVSDESFDFVRDDQPVIEFDIENILIDGTLLNVELNIGDDTDEDWRQFASFDEEGVVSFEVFEALDELDLDEDIDEFSSPIQFEIVAEIPRVNIALNSVSIYQNGEEEPFYSASGFDLAQYQLSAPASTGNFRRANGEQIVASFDYDVYAEAMGVRDPGAYSARDTYQLLEENQDICSLDGVDIDFDNVDYDDAQQLIGMEFSDTCPINNIYDVSSPIERDGDTYFNFRLELNYAQYMGYDDIPYFLFGTTRSGHDLFALTWLALRTSLLVGLLVGTINITIGIIYGSISGYYGGKVDIGMERFTEVISRIPWLLTLALATAWLGASLWSLVIVLTLSGWVSVSSTTRTQFYRYKGREYVLASRTLGAKDSRLIFRHILPNGIGTIITASILMIPQVIFAESTISFLGFGIGHGQTFNIFGFELSGVSIGVLLADGRSELVYNPHLTIAPAIIVSILMITFNMFGNALRDAFNPTLRGSE